TIPDTDAPWPTRIGTSRRPTFPWAPTRAIFMRRAPVCGRGEVPTVRRRGPCRHPGGSGALPGVGRSPEPDGLRGADEVAARRVLGAHGPAVRRARERARPRVARV